MSDEVRVDVGDLEAPLAEMIEIVGKAFPIRDDPRLEAPHRVVFYLEDVQGRPLEVRFAVRNGRLQVGPASLDPEFDVDASAPARSRDVCRWMRRRFRLRLLTAIS